MKTNMVQIKTIKKIKTDSHNYDIQIKDNHNFFANNILVHNSLGIMFFYAEKFRCATAGSFVSDQAKWAEKWSEENMPLDKMDKTNTYLFEIIYCENKIVVDYDFEGLVLLSIFDQHGLEYDYEQIKKESEYIETRCAKQYDFKDMKSIVEEAHTLDKNNEGYVIRFKSGYRLKIKGD